MFVGIDLLCCHRVPWDLLCFKGGKFVLQQWLWELNACGCKWEGCIVEGVMGVEKMTVHFFFLLWEIHLWSQIVFKVLQFLGAWTEFQNSNAYGCRASSLILFLDQAMLSHCRVEPLFGMCEKFLQEVDSFQRWETALLLLFVLFCILHWSWWYFFHM